VPPADFVLHNSLFLVAHFHNVIIGGVVFGLLAGVEYWFPKAFGYKLAPFWGKVSFWCWLIGFWVTFMPIYIVGLMGYTRRTQHFDDPDRPASPHDRSRRGVHHHGRDPRVRRAACGQLLPPRAAARPDR
jgi:heme/copper-type cytochrome/quinol oxidase subunit 1